MLIAPLPLNGSPLPLLFIVGSIAAYAGGTWSQDLVGKSIQPTDEDPTDVACHAWKKRALVESQDEGASPSHQHAGSLSPESEEGTGGDFEAVPLGEGFRHTEETPVHAIYQKDSPSQGANESTSFLGRMRRAMSMRGVDFTIPAYSVMPTVSGWSSRAMKHQDDGDGEKRPWSWSRSKSTKDWEKYEEAQFGLTNEDIDRWLEDQTVDVSMGRTKAVRAAKKTINISGNEDGGDGKLPLTVADRSGGGGRGKKILEDSHNEDESNSSISSHYSETGEIPASILPSLEDEHLSSFEESDLLRGSSSEGRSTFRLPRLSENEKPRRARLQKARAARENSLRKMVEGRTVDAASFMQRWPKPKPDRRENRYDFFQRYQPSAAVRQTQWENEKAAQISKSMANVGKYLARVFTAATDTQQLHLQELRTVSDPFINEKYIISQQDQHEPPKWGTSIRRKMKEDGQSSTERHAKRAPSSQMSSLAVADRDVEMIWPSRLDSQTSAPTPQSREWISDGARSDDDFDYDDPYPDLCETFDPTQCGRDALSKLAEACCPRKEQGPKEHSDSDLCSAPDSLSLEAPLTQGKPSLDYNTALVQQATPSRSRAAQAYRLVKRAPLPAHDEGIDEQEHEQDSQSMQRRFLPHGAIAHEALLKAAHRNGRAEHMDASLELHDRRTGGVYSLHRAALLRAKMPEPPTRKVPRPTLRPDTGHVSPPPPGEGDAPGGSAGHQGNKIGETPEHEHGEEEGLFSVFTQDDAPLPDVPSHRIVDLPIHETLHHPNDERMNRLKKDAISKGYMKNPEAFDDHDSGSRVHGMTREQMRDLTEHLEEYRKSRQGRDGDS